MANNEPTVGRIVNYTLSQGDVDQIIAERKAQPNHPSPAYHGQTIAHRSGNEPKVGQVCPMMIVAVWGKTTVNGQVFLDGNDVHWRTSATLGTKQGEWSWPVIPAPTEAGEAGEAKK